MRYGVTSIVLKTTKLDGIRKALIPRAEELLDVGARKVEARWVEYITDKKVVDTGAYRGSIHVVANHPALERTVSDGVTYGIYNEMGTSKVPARPCAAPAFEDERKPLMQAWGQLFR